MENPYQAPTAVVDDVPSDENNSGGGSAIVPPPGVSGWSWGAFLWNVTVHPAEAGIKEGVLALAP